MSAGSTTARKRDRLERYLRRRAAEGEFYFKSKYIADEVGLSTKEIGALLPDLRRSATAFDLEEWGYANATTWRVVPTGD
ncbi:hypothetical protein C2R22_06925 [Salinigranum rubrum]|uniref:DUF7123 domain-containing protein n=1 Tax=Salinigranum rubrum TaxID=755307 RepID=A0A2I8VHM2_9EURY|nr:hypothetical protein [Salinigranum rubrum]AUV81421.1 hypothetical protein C2R22_06925 [Salinigranum rubrum]